MADNDNDSLNEIQTVTKAGTIVTLSKGGGSFNVRDNDNDATNELQTISKSGDTLILSNGGGAVLIDDDGDWAANGNDIYKANSGFVGIGVSSPVALLHVSSSSSGNDQGLRITNGAANSVFYHNSSNDLIIQKFIHPNQLVLDDNGNVGVNTDNPESRFHLQDLFNGVNNYIVKIENSANFSGYSNGLLIQAGQNFHTDNSRMIRFARPDGTEIGAVRQITSSTVDYYSPSDQRLKTKIQATEMGLDELLQLEVKDYVYKDDLDKPQTGFLAQEVYKVYPNAVSTGGEDPKYDPWMISYGSLTPLIVQSVQDQQELIIELQKQVEQLEDLLKEESQKNNSLMERLDSLEAAIKSLQP